MSQSLVTKISSSESTVVVSTLNAVVICRWSDEDKMETDKEGRKKMRQWRKGEK